MHLKTSNLVNFILQDQKQNKQKDVRCKVPTNGGKAPQALLYPLSTFVEFVLAKASLRLPTYLRNPTVLEIHDPKSG